MMNPRKQNLYIEKIQVTASAGADIFDSCLNAVILSLIEKSIVELRFNGVIIEVNPENIMSPIVSQYRRESK